MDYFLHTLPNAIIYFQMNLNKLAQGKHHQQKLLMSQKPVTLLSLVSSAAVCEHVLCKHFISNIKITILLQSKCLPFSTLLYVVGVVIVLQ